MNRISDVVQFLANVASLVAFGFIVAIATHIYLQPSRNIQTPDDKLRRGTVLRVPGIDWTDAHSTLILALSVNCRYCRASSEFYRRLLSLDGHNQFRPVALFPQSQRDAQSYLDTEHILISKIIRADFQSLGVYATPTLILVDEVGKITASWIGKLSPEEEKDVMAQLQLQEGENFPATHDAGSVVVYKGKADINKLVSATEFVRIRKKRRNFPLLDIRPREEYATGHIVGTVNIPFDEISARAPHELPKDEELLVYCHYCPRCEGEKVQQGVETFCSFTLELLRHEGFTDAKLISADLRALRHVGVDIVGSSAAVLQPSP
jgi:hypothetical protein